MRNGQAFVGFREATINFPPTFKYDVLRINRHKRRRSKQAHTAVGVVASLSPEPADAGEQRELEGNHDCGHSEVSSEDDTELVSVISSGATTYSQRDQMSDEDNDSGAESYYLRRRMSYPQRSGGLVKRISVSAAQRAKSKWAELINAPSSRHFVRSRRVNTPTPQFGTDGKSPRSVQTTPLLGRRSTSSIDQPPDGILASSPPLRARVQPSPSFVGDGTAETEDDKGVYDSSSKQRVPSWCDRILFKSTVKPDPEPEDDAHAAPQRNAVSLLAQAWRSFRRSSSSSLRSVHNATANTTTLATSPLSNPISTSPVDSEPGSAMQPPLPTPYVPRRKRVRPHSIDTSTLASPSQPASLATTHPGTSSGAQTQRPPGVKGNTPPNLPPRKPTALSALVISPDQHHREPVSSFAGNMTRSSPTSSSDGPLGVTTPTSSSSDGRRGHPRWRLMSFLSRDAEAARDATGPADHVATSAAVANPTADSDSPRSMLGTAAPSSSLPGSGEPDGASASTESPRPRKGDIVCLSYRTLDDRGMRRLEGRSDHRPVVGVYAIYV
jgi:hypothetical protein